MTTTTSAGQHERVASELPEATALEEAVSQVGDRWTLLVVNSLLDGPRRFNELLDGMAGLAPNVLSKRLRHLEMSGLVVATPYTRRPPRFDYRLTATGAELASALRLLAHWGASGHPDAVPVQHSACGTPVEARWYCPTCARLVEADETDDTRFV
jgi:DNA-binding HxlR family transcriptional regulator